jgi:glycosyltransferase involved in cell wall biosynthesis
VQKKILVVVPAFNEASSIRGVISSIREEVKEAEILVVNDGSSDSTALEAASMNVHLLSHPFNLGIGATMQTGYKYAKSKNFDIVVQVDGDGQHPADQIRLLVNPVIRGETDIAIGSRFFSDCYDHTWVRWVGMQVFSKTISAIIGEKITDTTSGFRAVNSDVISFFSSHYPEDYPEVEAIVLCHRAGFRIREIPATFSKRKGGVSSISTVGGIFYMAKVLLAVFVDLLKRIEK